MLKMDKIIALVLVALLCATMVLSVSAETGAAAKIGETEYTTLADAVAAAKDGDEIVLQDNVDLGTEMLSIKKKLTLNLGGKTITSAYEGGYASIYVGTAGDLTVTGEGAITNTAGVAIGNYGKLTVTGGKITGKDAAVYNYYYNETTYGNATIAGGELNIVWNCGVMEVTGGTVDYLDNTHALTVSGGTVTDLVVSEADYAPVNGTTTTVTGGEVNVTAAANVGDAYFVTLAEAVAAAKDGDTVTVLEDVTLTEIVVIRSDITLDLGGKTVTGEAEHTIAVNATVTVKNGTVKAAGNALSVSTNGVLTVESGTYHSAGTYSQTAYIYAAITVEGKATINGGTFTSDASKAYAIRVCGVYADAELVVNDGTFQGPNVVCCGGKLVINDGKFSSEAKWSETESDILYVYQSGQIVVNGGEFVGQDPSNASTGAEPANYVAEGLHVVNENDTYTVGEHTYDNDCDVDCNGCGEERTPADHVYDDEYDATCNECGAEREVEAPAKTGDPICMIVLAALFSGTGIVTLTTKKYAK